MLSRRAVSLFAGALLVSVIAVPAFAGLQDVPFVDVPDSNVFAADIDWLGYWSISKGCNPPTNDRFCPNDNITREQMAALLVRALNLTDNGGGNTFTDDNDSVFEDDIAKLATAGITKGCNPPTNNHFCPTDNITRQQMAALLHRALTTASGPPSISDLHLSQNVFPVPQPGQSFPLTIQFEFQDLGRDLTTIDIWITGPKGLVYRLNDNFVGGFGTGGDVVAIDHTFVAGAYIVEVELRDGAGHTVGSSAEFTVDATNGDPG